MSEPVLPHQSVRDEKDQSLYKQGAWNKFVCANVEKEYRRYNFSLFHSKAISSKPKANYMLGGIGIMLLIAVLSLVFGFLNLVEMKVSVYITCLLLAFIIKTSTKYLVFVHFENWLKKNDNFRMFIFLNDDMFFFIFISALIWGVIGLVGSGSASLLSSKESKDVLKNESSYRTLFWCMFALCISSTVIFAGNVVVPNFFRTFVLLAVSSANVTCATFAFVKDPTKYSLEIACIFVSCLISFYSVGKGTANFDNATRKNYINSLITKREHGRVISQHLSNIQIKEFEVKKLQGIVKKYEATKKEEESIGYAFKDMNKEKGIIHIPYCNLKIDARLGVGNFGLVCSATWASNNGDMRVAVKQIKREKLHVKALKNLRFEMKVMAQVHHENVVKFFGASWDTPPNVCIVLEYMAGGNLTNHLENIKEDQSQRGFTRRTKNIALDVARGLKHMHHELGQQTSCIHRDIKSDNILLTSNFERAKIADLGESRFKEHGVTETMTMAGTPMYCAPEVLMNEAYDEKVDVFSFGVLLNQIQTLDRPYPAGNFSVVQVCGGTLRPRTLARHANPSVIGLIQQCWDGDASIRPSMLEVYKRLESSFGIEQ